VGTPELFKPRHIGVIKLTEGLEKAASSEMDNHFWRKGAVIKRQKENNYLLFVLSIESEFQKACVRGQEKVLVATFASALGPHTASKRSLAIHSGLAIRLGSHHFS
jgi:hypothetical protein